MAFSLLAETRQTPTPGPGANAVTSTAIDTTGADLILVAVASKGISAAINGFSDSAGNTWIALTARQASASSARIQYFYCISPTTSASHTIQFWANSSYPLIRVMAFSSSGTPVFDGEVGSNGSTTGTTLSPGSITPSEDGALVVSGIAVREEGSGPVVTGTGGLTLFTWVPTQASTALYPWSGGLAGYVIQTTASAVSPTYTWATSTPNAAGSVVFIEGASADETPPEIHGSTAPAVNTAGTQTTVTFTENVTGDGTGFSLNGTNALTYVSGDGTDTWVFSNATVVLDGDVVTLEYDDTTGNMADTSANVLDSFTGQAVNNGSTAVADTTPPTLSTITVVSALLIRFVFDEAVTLSDLTGWTMASSGAAITFSSSTGDETDTIDVVPSRSVVSTESLSFSYDSGTGNVTDIATNALATIANRLVTNNVSAVAGSGISRSRLVNQGG